jgi:hypothetical protein
LQRLPLLLVLSHQRNIFDVVISQEYLQVAAADRTLKLFKIGNVIIYDRSSARKARMLSMNHAILWRSLPQRI